MAQPLQPKVTIGRKLVQALVVGTTLVALLASFFGALSNWWVFDWSDFRDPVVWKGVWRSWVFGVIGFLLLWNLFPRVLENDLGFPLGSSDITADLLGAFIRWVLGIVVLPFAAVVILKFLIFIFS